MSAAVSPYWIWLNKGLWVWANTCLLAGPSKAGVVPLPEGQMSSWTQVLILSVLTTQQPRQLSHNISVSLHAEGGLLYATKWMHSTRLVGFYYDTIMKTVSQGRTFHQFQPSNLFKRGLMKGWEQLWGVHLLRYGKPNSCHRSWLRKICVPMRRAASHR